MTLAGAASGAMGKPKIKGGMVPGMSWHRPGIGEGVSKPDGVAPNASQLPGLSQNRWSSGRGCLGGAAGPPCRNVRIWGFLLRAFLGCKSVNIWGFLVFFEISPFLNLCALLRDKSEPLLHFSPSSL